MTERRYDIDWLRVVAILGIFIMHSSRFFDIGSWHLKNAEQSFTVLGVRFFFIWVWVMELLFLLSGAASWFSLRSRNGGQYLVERVKRLLIPLYGVGMIVLLAPQLWFELVTNRGLSDTFWQFLPQYFAGLPRDIIGFAPHALQYPSFLVPFGFPGHLWFLQWLFLISLITLPLLLYLKSEKGQRLIGKLAGVCERPGGVFIFVIPMAVFLIGLRFLFRGERTWADFLYYMTFFMIGYIMAANPKFTEGFKKHRWVCLALWIAGAGGIFFFILVLGYKFPDYEPFSLKYVLFQIVYSIMSWSSVIFLLSLGAMYMRSPKKVLTYSNEAVLPFYIFHQTVILCVGWFVIRWDMGILPKFLIIAVISFVLIGGLYEGVVRHFNWVRFLFGMRLKKKPVKE
ncbi:MAG: acyltransferase [Spirochaetota bacterium]|nr:MAG: acyltransferase [Spirochaetota bacterium]